jgi:hypothetical protein
MGLALYENRMCPSRFKQLFELEEVSPVLHGQRIEVNFIRLIEEKQQENCKPSRNTEA